MHCSTKTVALLALSFFGATAMAAEEAKRSDPSVASVHYPVGRINMLSELRSRTTTSTEKEAAGKKSTSKTTTKSTVKTKGKTTKGKSKTKTKTSAAAAAAAAAEEARKKSKAKAAKTLKPVVATLNNLQRRQDHSPGPNLYTINITVGGQETSLMVDTGSPEMWVNPNCSDAMPVGQLMGEIFVGGDYLSEEYCRSIGRYKPASSTSSKSLKSNGTIAYGGGGTQVDIDYYTDKVEVGGASLTGQQFGVATTSTRLGVGILGMGPNVWYSWENKSGVFTQSATAAGKLAKIKSKYDYPLVLDTMVTQGVIPSHTFSVALGNDQDKTGSLIFGGVDTGKFYGGPNDTHLAAIPFHPTVQSQCSADGSTCFDVKEYSYNVNVSSMATAVGNATNSVNLELPNGSFSVLVDTGNPNIALPTGMGKTVCSRMAGSDGSWDADFGQCWLNCNATSAARLTEKRLQFGFKDTSGNPKFVRAAFENLWYESNLVDVAAANNSGVEDTVNYLSGKVPFLSYLADLNLNYTALDAVDAYSDSAISADQTTGSIPKICYMNFIEGDDSSLALGTPFLRDAYVVFDWEVPQLWLGQAANCASDLQSVNTTANPQGIASLTSNCVAKGSSGSLSRKTWIIIGCVVGGVVLLMIIIAIVWAVMRQQRRGGGGGGASRGVAEPGHGLMAENEKDFSVVRGEEEEIDAQHEGSHMLHPDHGDGPHYRDAAGYGSTPMVHGGEADAYYAEGGHMHPVEPRPMA